MFALVRSLFRRAVKPAARPAGTKPPGFRPSVEALEERAVPILISNVVFPAAPLVQRPPIVRVNPGGEGLPPRIQHCVEEFRAMGVISPAARNRGNGQDKLFICHFTNSDTNPHNIIRVARPAAFGGHLRHGDIVFQRDTPTGPITIFFLNANGRLVTSHVG